MSIEEKINFRTRLSKNRRHISHLPSYHPHRYKRDRKRYPEYSRIYYNNSPNYSSEN